jgi:hypothetical protein
MAKVSLEDLQASGEAEAPARSTLDVGFVAPESAKGALEILRGHDIIIPAGTSLRSIDDWNRLVETTVAMHRMIREVAKQRHEIGKRLAKQRIAEGRIETFDLPDKPTTADPDWRKKWPWLEASPDEWRSYTARSKDGRSVGELVRIYPGENEELDRTIERIKELRSVLQQDILNMIRNSQR